MVSGEEKFILLRTDDIHEGIAGIVAGKIKDSQGKPVIIVTPSEDGYLKGTGRSVEAVDIFALLKRHAELFARFGGHRSACGFLMAEENLETLRRTLTADMAELEAAGALAETGNVWETEISPGELSLELAEGVERMQPFGKDNPRPVFLMREVTPQRVRFMGEDGIHAAFAAYGDGAYADCVIFRRGQEMRETLMAGEPVDIVGTVNIKTWNGNKSVQFIAEEIIAS